MNKEILKGQFEYNDGSLYSSDKHKLVFTHQIYDYLMRRVCAITTAHATDLLVDFANIDRVLASDNIDVLSALDKNIYIYDCGTCSQTYMDITGIKPVEAYNVRLDVTDKINATWYGDIVLTRIM